MGSDAPCRKKHVPRARGDSYGQRRFIKRSSRPANAVGALATGFNPAGQPAFVPRLANTAGRASPHLCALAAYAACGGQSPLLCRAKGAGGFLWEAVRRRRELGAGSTRRAVPAFMRRHMAAGGSLWEAIPCYGAGLLLGSDAPQARRGCRLSPADRVRIYAPPMAAGRASPLLCRASPIRRARGVLWEVAAL